MVKIITFLLALILNINNFALAQDAKTNKWINYTQLPMIKNKEVLLKDRAKIYRKKVSAFYLAPSISFVKYNKDVYFEEGEDSKSIEIDYNRAEDGFCGAYVMLLADISEYRSLSFMVKGKEGQENFEIGLKDVVGHQRQDAVYAGSIYHYLPNGLTTEWQQVVVPLDDFFGIDKSNLFSLTILFEEPQRGTIFIDEIKFSKEVFIDRQKEIEKQGFLLLDNFDHSDLNNLGLKTHTYKRLPSYCKTQRTTDVFYGEEGKSLKLEYHRDYSGWCGYYSLLNYAETEFFDLSQFKNLSFMVKGERGGEMFTVGLADEDYLLVGDALKIEEISQYLPSGTVTTKWQEVTIPLSDFEGLDLKRIASFVIDFPEIQDGIIYIDLIKFNLK
jgi:hypothetical protein